MQKNKSLLQKRCLIKENWLKNLISANDFSDNLLKVDDPLLAVTDKTQHKDLGQSRKRNLVKCIRMNWVHQMCRCFPLGPDCEVGAEQLMKAELFRVVGDLLRVGLLAVPQVQRVAQLKVLLSSSLWHADLSLETEPVGS